jgi:hypothetical protein
MDDGKAMFDRIAWQTKGLPRRYDEKGNGYALASDCKSEIGRNS